MRLVRGGEDTFLELKVKLSNSERIAQEIVALANTGGGVMVFGVNDQMRVEGIEDSERVQEELVRICRAEIEPPIIPFIDRIAFDNGRRIVAIDIEGKQRPYRTRDGRFFVRIGADKREASREEFGALIGEARPSSYENVPVLGAQISDIDEGPLWSFARAFEGDALGEASAQGYPTGEVLERHLLLAESLGGDIVPTVAGLLLFGRDKSVSKLLPNSSVVATRFGGETSGAPVVERITLEGNLATIHEAALRFISRYADLLDTRPRHLSAQDAPVPARANYHRGAVSEALANALVHRDLALRDLTTRLHILDRAIEIVNPRRSAGFAPFAQKAIRYGVPLRLNPQLAAIFSSPAYGLQLARGGLPMLLREARLFANRRPEIAAFSDEFRIRLFGI